MDLKEIKELIKIVEEGKLDKFIVKRGDFELHLEKHAPQVVSAPVRAALPHPIEHVESAPKGERPVSHRAPEPEGKFVSSPMVGTYYASPAPDKPHFVKVGDRVEEGTVVCIIEAMKVMNEVKANISGTVAEILVDNAHPVEFGTKLIRIV